MRSAGGTVADVTDAIHAHLTLILSDVTLCHIVTLSWLYSHG